MNNQQELIKAVAGQNPDRKTADYFWFALLFFLISGCTSESKFVVPVNPADLFGDSTKVFSAEGSKELTKSFIEKLNENTVGKEFPAIRVFNFHEEEFTLDEVLPSNCIVIAGDMHCFVGVTGMMNDFPQALAEFEHQHQLPKVVCLLTRTGTDLEYPEDFERSILQLEELYASVYVIEQSEALRMNAIFPSTRFYVENKVVRHLAFGISNVEVMKRELVRYASKGTGN